MRGPANNPELVSDCEALLQIRDILAGSGTLDWSADTPIDRWQGINVSGSPLRVTGILMSHSGLTGEIPGEVAMLSALEQLVLEDNQLTGEIPRELGRPV